MKRVKNIKGIKNCVFKSHFFGYLINFLLFILLSFESIAQVSPQERQALIDLYDATGGTSWKNTVENNQPWLINDPNSTVDTWYGVTVSGGKVTKLQLNKNTLVGTIPASIGNLSGLTDLVLSRNTFSGGIPDAIGQLENLKNMDLSRSKFTGSIPVSLTNLIKMERLSLNYNQLSGFIPLDIGNLQQLKVLYLESNQLQGTLPSSLGNLSNLSVLYLDKNELEGELPTELGNMSNLGAFTISENKLTGTIPTSLGNLTKLYSLSLHKNQLTGVIPDSFGNLINMTRLYLTENQLSGEIPDAMGNMVKMHTLLLGKNQLTGAIPTSFNQMVNITYMDFEGNQLNGPISINVAQQSKLKTFLIWRNKFVFSDFEDEHANYIEHFTRYYYKSQSKVDQEENIAIAKGESITLTSTMTSTNNTYQWYKNNVAIPNSDNKNLVITNASDTDAGVYHFTVTNSKITDYTLTRNPITLVITERNEPVDTCGVSESQKQALLDFYTSTNGDNWTNTVANNALWDVNTPVCDWYGVIVVDGKVTQLNLENNNLSGSIPVAIGDLETLILFNVKGNTLSGQLPTTFSQLTSLQVLNLENNRYAESFPEVLLGLPNILRIHLKGNEFFGPIPNTIGDLKTLNYLELGANNFTGTIPNRIGELTALTRLNITGNQINGTLPADIGNLTNLEILALGGNELEEAIPAVYQQLTSLKQLYLNDNMLEGAIPNGIAALPNLNTVELQKNNFSGMLPRFDQITGLKELRIEGNKYVFSDFEAEFVAYQTKLGQDFTYNFQDKVDEVETKYVIPNSSITLTSTALTSEHNTYKWYKTVNGTTEEITGTSDKILVITEAQPEDAGVYHFVATNTIVDNLALTRNSIAVVVEEDTCGVSESEKQALLDLYNATNGANWTNTLANNQLWSPNTPVCNWYGVTVVDGKVTQLNLENNALQGTIPSSMSSLSNLTSLDLNTNILTGEIPSSLGALLELTYLSLHHNNLSGVLSPTLGSLSNLTVMDLSHNGTLTGLIPIAFCNLANLTILNLSNNQLSGAIPKELGILTKLVRLDLNNNRLEGNIPPQLTSLNQLEFLGLSSNKLSGTIPFVVAPSSTLETLTFDNNNFIFSDFQSKHPGYLQNVNTLYSYAPQAKTDTEEIKMVTVGKNIFLSSAPFSSSNTYKWYKDGVLIPEATSRNYTIENASPADAGQYYVVVTNSIIDDLVLTRNTITLEVKDDCNIPITERRALINLFGATDGINWTNTRANNQPWLVEDINAAVCDWYGVVVENNTVVELNLSNNNLLGILPNVFTALPSLKKINIQGNNLQGSVPVSIASISGLETLAIENNNFVFNDFEAQFSTYHALNFTYNPQDAVDEATIENYDLGGTITLTSTQLSSTANQYQWFKNGLPIQNANSKDLVINNPTAEDSGMYFLEATNTTVTGLTIRRNPISVTVLAEGDTCGVSNTEKQALIDLYNGTNGANWVNNTNWLTDAPVCDWHGVTVVDGKVVKLNLGSNDLNGVLGQSIYNLIYLSEIRIDANKELTGALSNDIAKLTNLVKFNISGCNLSGNIPEKIVDLANLEQLILAFNNIGGFIPSDIGKLQNLKLLLLQSNELEGIIPNSLGNILGIEHVDLSVNNLNKGIPDSIVNLRNLQILKLFSNNLDGAIPADIGDLTNLKELQLGNNGLGGTIPESITQLTNLTHFNIFNNKIGGVIPADIGNLTLMTSFVVASNELTGDIPSGMSNMNRLTNLNMHSNHLSGKIPSEFSQFSGLRFLLMYNNKFVFSDFEAEFDVYKTKLGNNGFRYTPQAKVDKEETIYVEVDQPITLPNRYLSSNNNRYQWYKKVNNAYNKIDGAEDREYTISKVKLEDAGEYIFRATNTVVDDLLLERNVVTIKIVEPGACDVSAEDRQALIDFYQTTNGDGWINTVAGNQPWLINDPTSKVCDWYGVTVTSDYKIAAIQLPNNNLRGEISPSIQGLVDLKVVDLSQNNIIGELSSALTSLSGLETLNLRENILVGAIPNSIDRMTSLEVLDLGMNRFSSEIPSTIGGLQKLSYLDLSVNKIEGTLPAGLWAIPSLKEIKLQENELQGTIADEIGNLSQLEVFWVSENNFSGSIPGTITAISGLYSVHLDANSFEGDLPRLIPDFNVPNTDVQIQNNRFVFSDFEPEHPAYRNNLSTYVYAPQAMVDKREIIEVTLGGEATLFTEALTSSNNTYNWYKDEDEFVKTTTLRQTNISNITINDIGDYYFTATNSVIENLTLVRHVITIKLADAVDPVIHNTQSFCISQTDIPKVGDLISPFSGIASWYATQSGGNPLASDIELEENSILWAEESSGTDRIAIKIEYEYGITQHDISDLGYQAFLISKNPTISDLKPQGNGIVWYEEASGGVSVKSTRALENGKSYYAQQGSGSCRFAVTVFVGVFEPEGDAWQPFCKSEDATIADLSQRFMVLSNHELVWYKNATGTDTYESAEGLVDKGVYFVSQREIATPENESKRMRISVAVFDVPPPVVTNRNQAFYINENETVHISDLRAIGGNILWYDAPFGGIAYSSSEVLIDGGVYYAAQTGRDCTPGALGCCISTSREQVTVRIFNEPLPSLVGCELFRPQPGNRYVINAWVRESGVQAINPVIRSFSEVSDTFTKLLNHVKDRVLSSEPKDTHIPVVYIPKPDTREFDVLVPFIKGAVDKNLTIYNFKRYTLTQENQGAEKVVGFEFSLTPGDNAFKFRYVTPRVKRSRIGSDRIYSYNYPLLHNPSLELTFTGTSVHNNTFYMTSSFRIVGGRYSCDETGIDTSSNGASGIAEQITEYTYVPDPNYQVMDYANSLVKLRYRDKDGKDIPQQTHEVEFRPKGAIIDGWQQVYADFIIPIEAANMQIRLESRLQGNDSNALLNAYFDDIRMHPYDGNMKTFVYDPITQRLVSELDENNYATFYEYDQEGGLIRVKKETETGIFTIQETRSGNSKLTNAQE